MKICQNCRRAFSGKGWKCPACGSQPGLCGNFPSFAPGAALRNDHYPPESFPVLAPLEGRHAWFRARNELVAWSIRKWLSTRGKFMEIGCGTGFVLSRVERDFPELETCGAEIHPEGLDFASRRLERSELLQMEALNLPYLEEFDIIGLFDTLEHIPEDEKALAEAHRALVPGGGLLLMVPQHRFLWSHVDEVSGHVRRYGRKDLLEKVRRAGFHVVAASSFVFFLLPVLWVLRWFKRKDKKDFDPAAELDLPPLVNSVLGWVLAFEVFLIRLGLRFPWGGSLLLVARKD